MQLNLLTGTKDNMFKSVSDIMLDLCIKIVSDIVVTIEQDTNI